MEERLMGWLDEIKAGDAVYVRYSHGGIYRYEVESASARIIDTGGGTKFYRKSGKSTGRGNSGVLIEPTPAIVDDHRERKVWWVLRNFAWHTPTLAQMDAVLAIIAPTPPEKGS
jgi:hypothetical protein